MKHLTLTVLLWLSGIAGSPLLLAERSPGGPPERSVIAELATDRTDYEPGSTAAIVGSEFLPHEMVALQVVHADGTASEGDGHQPWSVQANGNGDFLAQWHVCEGDCPGLELQVTAVGQQSGRTATALFGDGRQSVTPLASPSGQSGIQFQGWFNLALQWGG